MQFRVLHYERVESTNTVAARLADQGAAEGLVVSAEYQTRGRGQFKRRWQSPAKQNLLFSLLVRPKAKSGQISLITQLAAKAMCELLNGHYGLKAVIKRPNDVLVDGRKICGILTEAKSYPDKVESVIVGVGLNVNSPKKQIPARATSMHIELGRSFNKETILIEWLNEFKVIYESHF